MALNLVDAAKLAAGRDQTYLATVMELYARGSQVLQYLPFENIPGNALTFNQEQQLPAVAFRGVNEGYAEGTGKTSRVTESLAIAGGDLDVDVFIVKTGGADARASEEAMKIKALSLSITKTILTGSVASNIKSFNGLQVRLIGDQLLVHANVAANQGALSLTELDRLIDEVEDPTHLIMNKTLRRRLSSAARNYAVGGYITYDLDAFGRRVTKFNDLPILEVDKDEANDNILEFEEACGNSGTANCTSIYCVSLDDNGFMGLQNEDMSVRDLGEIDTKPVFRTRVEWYVTISIRRPRAAARLTSIRNKACVA